MSVGRGGALPHAFAVSRTWQRTRGSKEGETQMKRFLREEKGLTRSKTPERQCKNPQPKGEKIARKSGKQRERRASEV